MKNVDSDKSQFYKFLKKLHVMKEEAVCVLLHETNWPIQSRKYVSVSFCLLCISVSLQENIWYEEFIECEVHACMIIIVIYNGTENWPQICNIRNDIIPIDSRN